MIDGSQPIHPIPLRGITCSCGAELETVERPDALGLVCPRGCAYTPPENIRPARRARLCPRCTTPILRSVGQVGATPSIHRECRTAEELAALEAIRVDCKAYYEANKSKWVDYSERKRRRQGRA